MIETLASYVPVLITRRLTIDASPVTEPTAESFPAAVLFADISGITTLTETLAKQGPAGAETLTNLLNAYFGQLIDIIVAHGGDIAKFAGDALLALWPARAGLMPELEVDLDVATHRAVQCAYAIQQHLGKYQAIPGTDLSLKLAVGTGQVSALQLGGVYQRWEFLITGRPLTQVSQAEDFAEPGDVILSPQVWMLVRDECTGQLLDGNNFKLETITNPTLPVANSTPTLSPEVENALRAYIPGAILTRLAAGQSGWLAELRPVTILFINLPDLNDTTPLEQAQAAMCALQEALYRYEGSINKLSVDDKGTTLVAGLGLPPLAHEDDPVRAVQAAMAMQTTLQSLNLRCAIGITTGRAYCGSVGNTRRREYTMIGDVVNLAARLMQAAATLPLNPSQREGELKTSPSPGGTAPASRSTAEWAEGGQTPIFCDESTWQAAQSQIKFHTLPPISVKGKAKPVAVFNPKVDPNAPSIINTSESTDENITANETSHTSQMVGRLQEKMALADYQQVLLRGTGSIVIIQGEAGIGKSRLVEDTMEHAKTVGVHSLIGAGDAIEKNTSYHAWRPIFFQLFELDNDPTGYDARGHLSDTRQADVLARVESINPDLMRLAPLLKAVLPLNLPDNDLTAQMSGEVRADNTHDLLVQIVQAIVPQSPTMLVIEDAHWLDSASWTLLRLVNLEVHPLLLVVATRPIPDPAPTEYSHLLNALQSHHIQLKPLPIEDTLSLVSHNLGVDTLPKPLATLIIERAKGHPFFSEELAYAMRDVGLIEVNNGHCRLVADVSDLQNLDFPDTLQGVITSRIDRLMPQQQLTLKAASVIGRVFTFRILRDIYPIEADNAHLPDYLDALDRLDLTQLDTPEPELSYIFKHIITQEVAYNLMVFAQRRKLHQAIAEWFEQTYAGNLSPYYPLLAYHWQNVLDNQHHDPVLVAKAIGYLEKAGEQALHNFANQEAVGYFSTVISLDADATDQIDQLRRARWRRQLGEAYYRLGNVALAIENLKNAISLSGFAIQTSKTNLIISLITQGFIQILHRVWPNKFFGHSQEDKRILEAIHAHMILGVLYYFDNDLLSLVYSTIFGLNQSEKANLPSELTYFYGGTMMIIGASPFNNLAEYYGSRALETSQQSSQYDTRSVMWRDFAVYATGIGQWDRAIEAAERGEDLATHLGNQRVSGECKAIRAFPYYLMGDFARSTTLWTDVGRVAAKRDDVQTQCWSLCGKIENSLPVQLFSENESAVLIQDVETLLSKNLGKMDKIRLTGLLSKIYWRRGGMEPAQHAAAKAAQLALKIMPTAFYGLEGYASLAEVYLGLWEISIGRPSTQIKPLKKSSGQACKALHGFARAFPIAKPRAWLWQGLYHWLDGKHRKAHKAWQKSLVYAQELQMPYEKGLAHYQIGRHSEGEARQEHLTQAIKIFEQLGAHYHLGRAHQDLENPFSTTMRMKPRG